MIPYRIENDKLTLFVRLTPKGGWNGLDGIKQSANGKGWLKARVCAVSEDGKANAALEELLAKTFDVSKSAVTIVSGHASRNKHVEITAKIAAIIIVLNGLVLIDK